MAAPVEGGCLCGGVRFEVGAGVGPSGSRGAEAAPAESGAPHYRWMAYCHCSICRKHHGALFSASLGVDGEDFAWRSGAELVQHYRASDEFERPFCGRCGSKLPAASQVPGAINVPAGLLDADPGVRPRSHIFVRSKSPLCAIDDGLPRHETYPAGYRVPAVAAPDRALREGAVVGSCLCNAVQYEVEGPLGRMAHCHCPRCRRSSGSAYETVCLPALRGFRFTRGEERIRCYALRGEDPYEVSFCAHCGSLLPVVIGGLESVRIQVATLDTPVAPEPLGHVHVESGAPWHTITDTLPRFPAGVSAEAFRDTLAI